MFLDYYNLEPLFLAIHSALCSVMPEGLAIFLEGLVVGVVILLLYAVLAIILIYMERKVCAAFQCRIGPNRVGGKGGLLQVPADVIKILTKEIIELKNSDHFLYNLAPFLVILASILTFSCLPWNKGGEILHMNIGIFFVLAASSIGVLGILLAGWSSNSKYTIIGAVRSGAMIISYELSIGLTVLTMVMLSGTMDIQQIVSGQADGWNIFKGHITFFKAIIQFQNRIREPFTPNRPKAEFIMKHHHRQPQHQKKSLVRRFLGSIQFDFLNISGFDIHHRFFFNRKPRFLGSPPFSPVHGIHPKYHQSKPGSGNEVCPEGSGPLPASAGVRLGNSATSGSAATREYWRS